MNITSSIRISRLNICLKQGFFLILSLMFISCVTYAEIKGDGLPFVLTLKQLENWSVDNRLSDVNNIAKVPLSKRISAPLNVFQEELDREAKVLFAPDGMNNFGNYLTTQNKFNLYNFSRWSHIDILNWFAGTADHPIQIPARPWVETAHRNGVKVIGSVFLAIAEYGGNPDTVEKLLEQDARGRFVFADRLIEVANYYGFDGWLINQETNLAAVKNNKNELITDVSDPKRAKALAERMLAFMKYLTAIAPKNMEIHWYDAMIGNGEVKWQNEFNEKNQDFLHDAVPSADAMFVNYWWNRAMVERSHQRVKKLNRSPYDLYFGADLWPSRNAQRAFSRSQWLTWLFNKDGTRALSSIALFATNVNYNFDGTSHTSMFSSFKKNPQDYANFYNTEQRLFAGDDLNLAVNDESGWPGLGRYLPAKSTVLALPLHTSFNTGQGKIMMDQGKRKSGAWSNISLQDILPTWQFAIEGNTTVKVYYDFDEVFDGGSSLALTGDLSQGSVLIPLYRTDIQLSKMSELNVVFKGSEKTSFVYLESAQGKHYRFNLNSGKDIESKDKGPAWGKTTHSLAELAGMHIVKLGLGLDASEHKVITLNIGELVLH